MNFITDYLNKTLIPEWAKAYKLLSVQFATLGAAFTGAWMLMTDDQHQALLGYVGIKPGYAVLIGFLAIVWGRLKNQPDKVDPPKQDPAP